jgi:muconolactone delta-isomerase
VEYLVTMSTRVHPGTTDAEVDAVRTRESARSRQLVAQGHLLRLWRPPLQPGEWRTLGLFAADDGARLEEVLASMPLRIWRSDEVTQLLPHPDDPVRSGGQPTSSRPDTGTTEFLTTVAVTVPAGTPDEEVAAMTERQADRVRELAGDRHLLRLWALAGDGRALGLWQADDPAGMEAMLASLPLHAWASIQTTPLSPHPSDPGLTPG